MVITEIVALVLGQLQAVIPLSSITLPILTDEQEHENHGDADAHTDDAHQDGKGRLEIRGFALEEYVTGDDPAEVCEADLDGHADGSLVVAAHVVVDPAHCERCPCGAARAQEEYGHVSHADGDPCACEHNDYGEEGPEIHGDDEPEAVLRKVRQHGDYDG